MGNLRGLGSYLIFICAFLVAATYAGVLGDQNTSEQVKERLALLKFKHSVKDSYDMLSSWVGNNCCVWEGIHCDAITGNVESLHLIKFVQSFHLSGNEVNSSLAELKHLKHLDLSGNYFQERHIPKFIGSFKQLTYLNLSSAGFGGNIPHHIGNLSNLKVLDLSSNNLMVDDIAWISGLSSLEHLDLSQIDLSRALNRGMVFYMIPSLQVLRLSDCGLSNVDLPSFRNSSRILPNIKHLDLGLNYFKGPLPGFFQNLPSLTFLDLSSYNLSLACNFANLLSMIPSLFELHLSDCGLDKTHLSSPRLNFSTHSNIQHLDLSKNSIGGTFPSILTNMSSLTFLDLSYNMLNSSVPFMPNLLNLDLSNNQFKHIGDVGIWRQCHLRRLDASSNQFEKDVTDSPKNVSECSQYALEWLGLSQSLNGTIPKAIRRLHNLRVLNLSGSSLTGFILEFLGGLRYLEVLDLSYNELTGPIPTFHANLSKLDLSYNHLNGSIPKSIGNQVALTYLDLSSNRLTGPIPTSIGRLVSLQVFLVVDNMLSGSIPVTIGQLAKLHFLDFSNNSLEGVVSEAHLGNLSMLKYLNASFNTNLTFIASHEWILPCQLLYLDLTSCNIVNGFPQWLRNQRKLESLSLSNTTIYGLLPTWLRKMPIIPYLDLSHNKLSGPLTNLPNRETYGSRELLLFLQFNFFNESIPRSLCRRTDLESLDFSNNRLTGTLPECLENLQQLDSLMLSSNKLSGVIPSFKGLISLTRLELHNNNFFGKLPRELGNLPSIQNLNVGENKLSGNIPGWIGEKLKYVVVLRLHKNNFTGRIPESLCKASRLHVLDVAHNNLKGPIPRCLGKLNDMSNGNGYVFDGFYFNKDEVLVQVMKGVDIEYKKTWKMVYNMDLSSNNLVGEIPVELTALSMLIGLNLSNNHLNGSIPNNIGNLRRKLESLDLSGNELTGVIPQSMADLTFLSHLNLSHNNLSGRIPTGCQLQTLTDPSIYEGNKYLCGPPLSDNCSNPEDPTTTPTTSKKKHKGVDVLNNLWLFYLDVISGFATGFWGVIGVLVLKKQWRHNFSRSAEEIFDKIYVIFVVGVAKIKRQREAT